MKKRLILGLAALAAVTLTSCQKDQVINETPQQNAIEFGTYLGRDAQTKGSVLTTEGLKTQGFGVYAYYTDDADYDPASSKLNFMNNEKVTNINDSWVYSPVKYWPNESTDKLTFFAYAPYQDSRKASGTYLGDPKTTINVDTDVTKHIDYTWAEAGTSLTSLKNLTKQSIGSDVKFNFKHAMSRVGFKVEAVIDAEAANKNNGEIDVDGNDVTIAADTKITVQEVELISYDNFYNQAVLNLNGGTWSDHEQNNESYKLTSVNSQFTDAAENVTIAKAQLNNDSNYIMLIPQVTNIQVRVKYTVTTQDIKLTDEKSVVVNDITSNGFGFDFQQGKAYNFVLHLGLTSVRLSADVADWDTATGEDYAVNVPLNF